MLILRPFKGDLKVICHQNKTGLRLADETTIIGWMHGDEPDNAQSRGKGRGYGPPITPEKIVDGYNKIKQADSTRHVLLNLGQGVAWDRWPGRGVRTNHPEDYPQYVKGWRQNRRSHWRESKHSLPRRRLHG